jgi:hypothetical protein
LEIPVPFMLDLLILINQRHGLTDLEFQTLVEATLAQMHPEDRLLKGEPYKKEMSVKEILTALSHDLDRCPSFAVPILTTKEKACKKAQEMYDRLRARSVNANSRKHQSH